MEDEVADWYTHLTVTQAASVDRVLDLLAEKGNQLTMPHSRPLGKGLFELRFKLDNNQQRITYIFDIDKHIITLTTFRKTRSNESQQVARARRVQKRYLRRHSR